MIDPDNVPFEHNYLLLPVFDESRNSCHPYNKACGWLRKENSCNATVVDAQDIGQIPLNKSFI